MNKLKLEIDALIVHSFSTSAAHVEKKAAIADTYWCTLAGQCQSWFICTQEPEMGGA